jgi:hypothetical protein
VVSLPKARLNWKGKPVPVLYYYDCYGNAESIRMLFNYKNIDFDDERLNYEEFTNLKKSGLFEFGEMPVLVMDGTSY